MSACPSRGHDSAAVAYDVAVLHADVKLSRLASHERRRNCRLAPKRLETVDGRVNSYAYAIVDPKVRLPFERDDGRAHRSGLNCRRQRFDLALERGLADAVVSNDRDVLVHFEPVAFASENGSLDAALIAGRFAHGAR